MLCTICDFHCSPLPGSRVWCHLRWASCPKPWGPAAFSITGSLVLPPPKREYFHPRFDSVFFLGPDGLVPTTHLSGSLRRLMHFGNIKKKRKQCKLRLTNPRGVVGGGLSPQAGLVCCVVGLPKNGGVKNWRKRTAGKAKLSILKLLPSCLEPTSSTPVGCGDQVIPAATRYG